MRSRSFTPKTSKPVPRSCAGARTTGVRQTGVALDDVQVASRAAAYLLDCGSKQLAVVGMRDKNLDLSTILTATEGNAQLRARGVVEECATPWPRHG